MSRPPRGKSSPSCGSAAIRRRPSSRWCGSRALAKWVAGRGGAGSRCSWSRARRAAVAERPDGPRPAALASGVHTSTSVITIERFIMEQERLHPEATGELSNLLYDLCLAAKIISRHVRRAGLSDILGPAGGAVNVSGDLQQKLDLFAHDAVQNAVQHTGRVCLTASEEDERPVRGPPAKSAGKHVLLYDPLDGTTTIDVNASIGTLFSIHRRLSKRTEPAALEDCLQAAKENVAARHK